MKFEEARFFLDGLQNYVMIAPINGFLLSAFVSAARSVTFIMEKEFAAVEGFKAWWAAHPAKLRDDLKAFNNLRVLVVHQRAPNLTTFRIGSTFSAPSAPGESIVIPIVIGAPHQREVVATRKTTDGREERFSTTQTTDVLINEYFQDDKNEARTASVQGVISEGVNYLRTIGEVVAECEQRFGHRKPSADVNR